MVRCDTFISKPVVVINVYPNPVIDELTIEAKGNTIPIWFEIYNTIGQLICKGSMVGKIIIPTNRLAGGMYVIRFENGGRVIYKKVVKSN